MHEDFPEVASLLSAGHAYDLKTNVFEKLEDIIFFDEQPPSDDIAHVYGLKKMKRCTKSIKRKYLRTPENFEKWKVFVPQSNGSGALGEVLSTPVIGLPVIGLPVIGHTQTFMSMGCFETQFEAEALLKYVKSKFARTMLGVLKVTQHNPRNTWRYVPLQDFTPESDIDWTQSVADIDRQLYKKYSLSPEEIDFIESHVKEMV